MPAMAAVSGGSSSSAATTTASTAPSAAELRAAAAQAGPSGPPVRPQLTLAGPEQVHVGQEFDVAVHMSSDHGISHLHGQVRFDPTAVQLVSATAGDIVPASAGSPAVDGRTGGAQIDVTSNADPIQGEGSLMLLRFKALAPRTSSQVAAQVAALGAGGVPNGNAAAAPLNLLIQAAE
jgi:hypothetical protein